MTKSLSERLRSDAIVMRDEMDTGPMTQAADEIDRFNERERMGFVARETATDDRGLLQCPRRPPASQGRCGMIWKILLPNMVNTLVKISVPKGANFLSIGAQHSQVALWFAFPSANAETSVYRCIWLAETGKEEPPSSLFLGTVILMDGAYVLHAFEIVE